MLQIATISSQNKPCAHFHELSCKETNVDGLHHIESVIEIKKIHSQKFLSKNFHKKNQFNSDTKTTWKYLQYSKQREEKKRKSHNDFAKEMNFLQFKAYQLQHSLRPTGMTNVLKTGIPLSLTQLLR